MKIINFQATKVHGVHDFDLKFYNDISFLIGINGSGKTTALRLIQAALTLDFSTLFSIKFTSAQVTVEINGKKREITLKNEGTRLHITIDGVHADVNIPILEDKERGVYSKSGRLEEYLEEQRLRFIAEAGPQVQHFLKWPRPLFLGLERRTGRYDDETSYFEEDVETHIFHHPRRMQRGVIDGLENCQRLLERTYQTYRRISDGSNKRLINVIVASTFDYIEFNAEIFSKKGFDQSSFQDLITRRREIEVIAENLGGGTQATAQINNFFSKINEVTNEASEDADKHAIELMLNRTQLQRIQKLLAEMDKQKRAAESQYAPISEFLSSLNKFLGESRKTATVDALGRLSISQNGQPINLSWLSSGEKQLIILLAHAKFARSQEGVVIVDEPELSLHLRWQEMLIDSISSSNSKIQFIFATHSPEIVGYKKDNCIMVG
jgi:predicted ATP-binding protein involved in virulence